MSHAPPVASGLLGDAASAVPGTKTRTARRGPEDMESGKWKEAKAGLRARTDVHCVGEETCGPAMTSALEPAIGLPPHHRVFHVEDSG